MLEKMWSRALCLLGEQSQDICCELFKEGNALPAKVMQEAQLDMADTTAAKAALQTYWVEYAKERLAALKGPMDIMRGDLPAETEYRSEYLAELRKRRQSDVGAEKGAINSPQIEPTRKKFVELLPDSYLARSIAEKVVSERSSKSSCFENRNIDFLNLNEREKETELLRQYTSLFEPFNFTLRSKKTMGPVFGKMFSNAKFEFLYIDESKGIVDSGLISFRFGIAVPRRSVNLSNNSSGLIASFSPEDIVPCYYSARVFSLNSFPQFFLAIQSSVYLAKIIFDRIDGIISGAGVDADALAY